jgi:hypothetical protein
MSLAMLLTAGAAAAQEPPVPPPADQPPVGTEPPVEATTPPPIEPTVAVEVAPEPEKKASGSPVAAKFDKGLAFTSEDEQFELKLALRSQFRLQIQSDKDNEADEDGETTAQLSIPRFRVQFEGHIFGKSLRYKLELAAGDKSGASFAKDMFLDKQVGPVWVRVGQWKQPFTRQELVSDFGSVFNERSTIADWMATGRDQGIAVHNDYEKSPEGVEWVVGVFQNFAGKKDTPGSSAPDMGPTVIGRVGYNLGKVKGYTEADLDGGPLRLGVAVGAKYDFAQNADDAQQLALSADFILKVEGLDVQATWVMFQPAGEDVDAEHGFHGQVGYMMIPKHGQVAARFSMTPNGDSDRMFEDRMEILGAFNWYFEGHAWKWATDFGMVQDSGQPDGVADDEPTLRLRTMAQLTF